MCIGLVCYLEYVMFVDELMWNCDLVLYYVKYWLDNVICVFSDEFKCYSEECYKFEELLCWVIENGELEVYL